MQSAMTAAGMTAPTILDLGHLDGPVLCFGGP